MRIPDGLDIAGGHRGVDGSRNVVNMDVVYVMSRAFSHP